MWPEVYGTCDFYFFNSVPIILSASFPVLNIIVKYDVCDLKHFVELYVFLLDLDLNLL